MYRKYSSSAKYSRNERLAQLTEQESVIERKKREIQAKMEAQKKKEAVEVFQKLDSSSSTTNYDFLPAKKQNWNKKEKDEDEGSAVCPKNAFSNDGSFLDHFKKLSNPDFGSKGADISTLIKEKKLVKEKEYNKQIGKSQRRSENFDQQKDTTYRSINTKFQDSNVQLHLPPPGVAQLIPQHHGSVTMCQPSALNITQNEMNRNDKNSETASSSSFSNTSYIPSQFVSTENSVKNFCYQNPCKTSVSGIEPPPPMKPQNIPPPNPIKVHNIPPPPVASQNFEYTTETAEKQLRNTISSKHKSTKKDQEKNSDNELFANVENFYTAERHKQKNKMNDEKIAVQFSIKSQSREINIASLSETTSSPTAAESSRISPALSDDVDYIHMDRTMHSTQAAAREGRYPERSPSDGNLDDAASRYSPVKHQLTLQNESEDLSRLDRNQHGNASDSDEKSSSNKRRKRFSEHDSSDSDSTSRDSFHQRKKILHQDYDDVSKTLNNRDGYQADCEDESNYSRLDTGRKKIISKNSSEESCSIGSSNEEVVVKSKRNEQMVGSSVNSTSSEERKRKKKSRWGEEIVPSNSLSNTASNIGVQLPPSIVPLTSAPCAKTPMLSKLTRSDPGLIQYAKQAFGSTNLSEEDWKKAEDHYKINLLYQDMVKKRAEIDNLEKAGKFKYEYDSDEDVEGGTWEHKLRQQEMLATQLWAEELTRQAAGKHHIGDFLPPEELERFMEKYNAVKEGRKPDLSDYKEFKLKEDNVGYRLLQKMGWNEGQGLGQDGTGIVHPVNKAVTRHENQGLGIDRPDGLEAGDDEYDAYRKRMMLAYRFRPNPLNNPRRPYY